MNAVALSSDRDARRERALRSLEGLSVGDAFGERFFGPYSSVKGPLESRTLPASPWRWTDDTAMALGVVEVLSTDGAIDAGRLAAVFARNWRNDPMRGYGAGAQAILDEIHAGQDWRAVSEAAFGGSGSKGNGGGMRAGPLGAWFADDLTALDAAAEASARPTHAHREGIAGAMAVAAAAAYASRRREDPGGHPAAGLLPFVEDRLRDSLVRDGIRAAAAIAPASKIIIAAAALGTGAQVLAQDTIPFALWCAARHLDDYVEAMWTTVTGMGDRDTTCAIAGGIVALCAPSVPATWVAAREPLPPIVP